MKRDAFTKIILAMIALLLAWNVREARPVQAQGPYTVVRLGSSPNEWMSQLNNHGRKLVAVVPANHNGSTPDGHGESYIVILQ